MAYCLNFQQSTILITDKRPLGERITPDCIFTAIRAFPLLSFKPENIFLKYMLSERPHFTETT